MDVKTLSTSHSSVWIIQHLVLRHYNLLIFCFLPSSFFMSFISKKPSCIPCVLCSSLCPPCNILHDIDDYASFYDPCYYPHLHPSVFATRESTCAWLLSGLQTHSLSCERHLQTFSHVIVTTDDTSASPVRFFHFFMDGVHLCVPFADIESSLFSILSFTALTRPPSFKSWTVSFMRQRVVNDKTERRDRGAYLVASKSWSLFQFFIIIVSPTTHFSYYIFTTCYIPSKKNADSSHSSWFFWTAVQLVANYKTQLIPLRTLPFPLFLNRYQDSVFHALCDLRTSNHFRTTDSFLDLIPSSHCSSSEMWLYQTLDDMDSRLHRAHRDEILSCLHPFLPIWGHNIVLNPYVRAVHLSCFTSGLGSGILAHFPTIPSFKFYFRSSHFTTTHL